MAQRSRPLLPNVFGAGRAEPPAGQRSSNGNAVILSAVGVTSTGEDQVEAFVRQQMLTSGRRGGYSSGSDDGSSGSIASDPEDDGSSVAKAPRRNSSSSYPAPRSKPSGKPAAKRAAKAAAKPVARARLASEAGLDRPAAQVARPRSEAVDDNGDDAAAYFGDEADEGELVNPPGAAVGVDAEPAARRRPALAPCMQSLVGVMGPPPPDASGCWRCGQHRKTQDSSAEGMVLLERTFDDTIQTADFSHVAVRLHATFTRCIRFKAVSAWMKREVRAAMTPEELETYYNFDLVSLAEQDRLLVLNPEHELAGDPRVVELFDRACNHTYPDWPGTAIFWHYLIHESNEIRFVMVIKKLLGEMVIRTLLFNSWDLPIAAPPDAMPSVDAGCVKMLKELLGMRHHMASSSNTRAIATYTENLATNTTQDIQRMLTRTAVPLTVRRTLTPAKQRH